MKDLKFNPWFSIWSQPKKTIREIINFNPKMGFFILASIWFLQLFFLFEVHYKIVFNSWFLSFLIALIASPFVGGIYFYFFGSLLFLFGRLLKGKALFFHNVSAFAWSRIPLIINLVIYFVISFFVYNEVSLLPKSFIFINLITFIVNFWSFFLLVNVIREIQGFSFFKAIINVLLVYFVVLILSFVINLLINF